MPKVDAGIKNSLVWHNFNMFVLLNSKYISLGLILLWFNDLHYGIHMVISCKDFIS